MLGNRRRIFMRLAKALPLTHEMALGPNALGGRGARPRNERVRIDSGTLRASRPGLTDPLERRAPSKTLEVSGEVVSHYKSQYVHL